MRKVQLSDFTNIDRDFPYSIEAVDRAVSKGTITQSHARLLMAVARGEHVFDGKIPACETCKYLGVNFDDDPRYTACMSPRAFFGGVYAI